MTTDSIQTRKLVSASGGPGSLIESRKGALLVRPHDEWPYVYRKAVDEEKYRLNDMRLLGRLRSHFTDLRRLAQVPHDIAPDYPGAPGKVKYHAAAEYFPRWFYCAACTRLDALVNWQRLWLDTVTKASDRDQFDPPHCIHCYLLHGGKGAASWHNLEQVRFVMTSPNGALADVPWAHWTLRRLRAGGASGAIADDPASSTLPDADDAGESENDGTTRLDMDAPLPDNLRLYYRTSARFNDLKGITIEARIGSERPADGAGPGPERRLAVMSLAGLFGLRVPEAAMADQGVRIGKGNRSTLMKPVLRASNSVYYPHVVHSLFLPKQPLPTVATGTFTEEWAAKIKGWVEDLDSTPPQIVKGLAKNGLLATEAEVERLIVNDFEVLPPVPEALDQDEMEYRRTEFAYLTGPATTEVPLTDHDEVAPHKSELIVRLSAPPAGLPGLSALYRVDRLKMTTVQTSYTRQQPLDRDAYLIDNAQLAADEVGVRRCYTTRFGPKTHTLLGVENYGEGLLLTLDEAKLKPWEASADVQRLVREVRTNQLQLSPGSPAAGRTVSGRSVLLHTLSHLLMRELEFQCGYPVTSLQERLYADASMAGVLIYTIAGAEGSYGGLTSIIRTGRFPNLFRAALLRAQDCAADPICWHTDQQGQGVGGLNGAACASCALVPETSCEEFNSFLDRRLVVDTKFGFFRALVDGL